MKLPSCLPVQLVVVSDVTETVDSGSLRDSSVCCESFPRSPHQPTTWSGRSLVFRVDQSPRPATPRGLQRSAHNSRPNVLENGLALLTGVAWPIAQMARCFPNQEPASLSPRACAHEQRPPDTHTPSWCSFCARALTTPRVHHLVEISFLFPQVLPIDMPLST